MNRIIKNISAPLLAFLLCMAVPAPLLAINDTIIAVVNDDVITSEDLHEYLEAMFMQLAAEGKSKPGRV